VVWIPQLDPTAILLAPAPPEFDASSLRSLVPEFQHRASDGDYWLIRRGPHRIAVVILEDNRTTEPASGLVPLDTAFPKRIEALLEFWRFLHDRSPLLPRDPLTRLERERLILKLRALDGRLAGETYREIAQVLSARGRRLEHRPWKSHDRRSWIIRLVKEGERLMRGGYRDLVQRG
jgi:hypothetical protein